MINGCGNCANYVWGDKKTPLPSECITCTTTYVPNGQHTTPSHWKAKPQTNADHFRAMSDEEVADIVVCPHTGNWDLCRDDCKKCRLEWLKKPVEVSENG